MSWHEVVKKEVGEKSPNSLDKENEKATVKVAKQFKIETEL